MKSAPTPVRRCRFHSIHDRRIPARRSPRPPPRRPLPSRFRSPRSRRRSPGIVRRGTPGIARMRWIRIFLEKLVVVERAVDAAIEVARRRPAARASSLMYSWSVPLARYSSKPRALQRFQQAPRARHQILFGRAAAGAQFLEAVLNHVVQAVQVHPLVFQRIERRAAAARHLIGERDHLVHGLLAGEAPDEILDHRAQFALRFRRY